MQVLETHAGGSTCQGSIVPPIKGSCIYLFGRFLGQAVNIENRTLTLFL